MESISIFINFSSFFSFLRTRVSINFRNLSNLVFVERNRFGGNESLIFAILRNVFLVLILFRLIPLVAYQKVQFVCRRRVHRFSPFIASRSVWDPRGLWVCDGTHTTANFTFNERLKALFLPHVAGLSDGERSSPDSRNPSKTRGRRPDLLLYKCI